MKYSLHPEAQQDLRDAAEFYRNRAGSSVSQSLFAEFEHIQRFPYSIIYTVVGDEIRILAVAHQSRHPGFWRSRK